MNLFYKTASAGLFAALLCTTAGAQEVMRVQNGALLTVQSGAGLTLQGGLTLDQGAGLVNNGSVTLKNNSTAGSSNWTDSSAAGALSGSGWVQFNSASPQSISGSSFFNYLQVNTAGLSLNNPVSAATLRLMNGVVNTGSHSLHVTGSSAASLENDTTNPAYAYSWINGSLQRSISANTATYDFPVGGSTRSNLLQFINNNLNGVSDLTASFGPKPGTDTGMAVTENKIRYSSVNSGGVWYLSPNTAPSGGNYALQLYFDGFTGLADNLFAPLRRPDSGSHAADWQAPSGSSLEPTGGAGRLVSDGYARRTGITGFSQWGIGQGQQLYTFYRDADGDGYGTDSVAIDAPQAPEGYVTDNTDCNDGSNAVYPGASELCDGLDNDCDGSIDEGITLTTFYRDGDSDGYGNAADSTQACTAPQGYVSDSTDCDDTKASVRPGATEIANGIDDDCDGQTDELTTFYKDYDKDGYGNNNSTVQAYTAPKGYVATGGDCNDAKNTIYPNAPEICDNLDNDCDGQKDEGIATTTFYKDYDRDGYGNLKAPIQACTAPAGYVTDSTDCNDVKNAIYPGAPEICDNLDNDCDGQIDEGLTVTTFYKDYDKDTYGSNTATVQACVAPYGYIARGGDCNDAKAAINPGATEIADNLDNDCDGQVDEGFGQITYYKDFDKDGFGNINVKVVATTPPAGYVADSSDCNDGKNTIYPGALELCDNLDNNCNGLIDEGLTLTTFYKDYDKDGRGNINSKVQACVAPATYVSDSSDCNDGKNTIYPGAPELCDNLDNDCDGQVDEGFTLTTFYKDYDKDGYGSNTVSVQACVQPAGYVMVSGDCNDAKNTINPGVAEVAGNRIDDNCNGVADEGMTVSAGTRAMEESVPFAVSAMPNPSAGRFILRIQGTSGKPVLVSIRNAVGQLVEAERIMPANATMEIGRHYRPGVYVVEVIQGSERRTLKLVKQPD